MAPHAVIFLLSAKNDYIPKYLYYENTSAIFAQVMVLLLNDVNEQRQ